MSQLEFVLVAPPGLVPILGEMAAFVEEIEAGKHEPPKKADGGNWGEVDEYEAPCCKVWIQDHARK